MKIEEQEMRAISDEEVKALIYSGICTDTDADREYVCECIDNIPTIEPKRGRWLETDCVDGDDQPMCRCSECGYLFNWTGWNFCPNCGADMRGGER